MILGLHVGDEADASSWEQLVKGFAAWLGLLPQIDCRAMPDGRRLSLTFIEHPANAGLDWPILTCGDLIITRSRRAREPQRTLSAAELWRQMEQAPGRNEIRMAIKLDSGELRASVPIATPDQVFYSDNGRGFAVANDMRLVTRWAGGSLSPVALFALFQYGTIPAPLSLSDKVVRVAPGHILEWHHGRGAVTTPLPGPTDSPERASAGAASEALLLQALDTELAQAPQGTVLYFSGGVDSSLMASRVKRIGRADISLVNFAFGPQDGEARLAGEVASHLGLRCEHIFFDPGDVSALLARVGRDYSYPFSDDSTIPTNLLVHASVKALGPGRTVLEGTGADGGFGPVVRRPDLWQRLYMVPAPVRRLVGASYKQLSLWGHGRLMAKARVLAYSARQSADVRMEVAAVLASNALDGIAYSIPLDVRQLLGESLGEPLRIWGKHLNLGERFALLDLIYVCAARFAAKSFDPLRRAGMNPVYPFLEPSMLSASFRLPWEEKVRGGEGKILLKRLLARETRDEWIYRRKSAFDAPLGTVLARPEVQDWLHDIVFSDRNPLLEFIEVGVVRRLAELCRVSKRLQLSVLRFLWAVLFVSVWLDQVGFTWRSGISVCTRR
jgi:asparagine synthetase B (glutamine-hydrolysing)